MPALAPVTKIVFKSQSSPSYETDLLYLGGLPQPLRGLLGINVLELETLFDTEHNQVVFQGQPFETRDYSAIIQAETAEVLGEYQADFYQPLWLSFSDPLFSDNGRIPFAWQILTSAFHNLINSASTTPNSLTDTRIATSLVSSNQGYLLPRKYSKEMFVWLARFWHFQKKLFYTYPIANNGSASTPFYTALCLWVGALLLSSVATTEYHLEKKDKKRFTQRETFVARMLTFLTMAVAQSLIVTLGNMFLLGVDVHNPVYSVFFALLVGLAFMMIVYVLAGLFGNLGKGIAIIILVLSISGGGGNYPIQVSGKFFQFINPLLPFTHAVNLLRESAGGIYWPNAIPQLIILTILFLVFGIVGTYAYPYLVNSTKKLSDISKESHFFH